MEGAFQIVWGMHEGESISVEEHVASEQTIRAFVTDPEWKYMIKGVAKWTYEQCSTSYAQWYKSRVHDGGKRRKRA